MELGWDRCGQDPTRQRLSDIPPSSCRLHQLILMFFNDSASPLSLNLNLIFSVGSSFVGTDAD